METDRMFLEVDVCDWVEQAVEYAKSGTEWESAWFNAYFDVEGEWESVAEKSCPMNGTYTLYWLGRIKNSGVGYKKYNLDSQWKRSRNGTYAMLALETSQGCRRRLESVAKGRFESTSSADSLLPFDCCRVS